jgi:hypothetical protein
MIGDSNGIGLTAYQPNVADKIIRLYPELGSVILPYQADTMTSGEYPPGDNPALPRFSQRVTRNAFDLAPVIFGGVPRSGSEIEFGRYTHYHYGTAHKTTIVKMAFGGSALGREWMNSISVDLSDRSIMLLSELGRKFQQVGETIVLQGVVINLGTNDIGCPVCAEYFVDDMEALIAKYRGWANNKKLPVVITRPNVLTTGMSEQQLSDYAKIRVAFNIIPARDPCVASVSTDSLIHINSAHFKPDQYNILGRWQYVVSQNILARASCAQ